MHETRDDTAQSSAARIVGKRRTHGQSMLLEFVAGNAVDNVRKELRVALRKLKELLPGLVLSEPGPAGLVDDFRTLQTCAKGEYRTLVY